MNKKQQISGSNYCIYKGFGKEAAGIAIGAIASVAGVFVFFKRANKSNKE